MRLPFFSRADWKDPDWKIREQAAFQLRDQDKLLFLAMQDVSEEVRVAASKSLRDDKYRLQLVQSGYCEHARRLATAAIQDRAMLLSVVKNRALPAELRLVAAERVSLSQPEYLAFATNETELGLRAWAVKHLEKSSRVNDLYSPTLPEAIRLALIPKLTDTTLLAQIVRTETVLVLQSLALSELTDESQLAGLFPQLEDTSLRREIIDKVRAPNLVLEMLAEADEEPLRLYLIERLQDQTTLERVARSDRHASVRIAAVKKLRDTSTAVAVINRDPDRRVRLAALEMLSDESALASVAQTCDDEQIRWRAVERIQQASLLEKLEQTAPHADVQWPAGRKIGHAPLDRLLAITSPWVLRRMADSEPDAVLQQMIVRLMRERHVVEELVGSKVPAIAETARQILQTTTGPAGISFVPIPGRPYEISLFFVTQSQARTLLGPDPRWQSGDDLPATGMTPREAEKICALLHKEDGAFYRLPSFEEWLHASVGGDKRWLVPPLDQAKEPWLSARLHLNATAPRPLGRAWPNPWGVLDALGNVAVWVDEDPGPASWISHNQERDPLSRGNQPDDLKTEDYAVAAGPHWADRQLKQTRWERLIRLANLGEYGRDKVGLRLVRAVKKVRLNPTEYRMVLETEPRWGLTREEVTARLARSTIYSLGELEKFYRVAPIAVLASPDYEFVRKLQSAFRRCGAEVSIVTKTIEPLKGAAAG